MEGRQEVTEMKRTGGQIWTLKAHVSTIAQCSAHKAASLATLPKRHSTNETSVKKKKLAFSFR